jgi:hypothetical protein
MVREFEGEVWGKRERERGEKKVLREGLMQRGF